MAPRRRVAVVTAILAATTGVLAAPALAADDGVTLCSELGGRADGIHLTGDLVADSGDCWISDSVVEGDVVVRAEGLLSLGHGVVEGDLRVAGDATTTQVEVRGDVVAESPGATVVLSSSDVRRSVRGDAYHLQWYRTTIGGDLAVRVHGGEMRTTDGRVAGSATTWGGKVYLRGTRFDGGLSVHGAEGRNVTTRDRTVWLCDVHVAGDLTFVDLREPLRREPDPARGLCQGDVTPTVTVDGDLVVRDSAPLSHYPPALTLTDFHVAGDLVCTGNVGRLVVASDVVVGGERHGQCAGAPMAGAGAAPPAAAAVVAAEGVPAASATTTSTGTLRCSDVAGVVAHRRVEGDLLVDGDCHLTKAVVTGDAVVEQGARLWATSSAVKGDVLAEGRVVLDRATVHGGIRVDGAASSLAAQDATVVRSIRGAYPDVVDLIRATVGGNVAVEVTTWVAFTDSELQGHVWAEGTSWVTRSTFARDVTARTAIRTAYPTPGHPYVWWCDARIAGNLNLKGMRTSVRLPDPAPGDPCGGQPARNVVAGFLRVVQPLTDGPMVVRSFDVAGDFVCAARPGRVVIGPDVTVGGRRGDTCD